MRLKPCAAPLRSVKGAAQESIGDALSPRPLLPGVTVAAPRDPLAQTPNAHFNSKGVVWGWRPYVQLAELRLDLGSLFKGQGPVFFSLFVAQSARRILALRARPRGARGCTGLS